MNVREPEITSVTELTDKELTQQWKNIDWKRVKEVVNNLQSRIASAAKNGNWKTVNKLSRLLTRSFYAKLLSVRKVTTNKGSRTPGIDGVIWSSSADKMRAALQLTNKGYRAKPLTRKYIRKKSGKLRPLSIPTMYDRAMQTLHSLVLGAIESAAGDKTSFGFKPYRSTKDAYAYLHLCLSKKVSPEWIVEGDIKACFDEISHNWILDNIPIDKRILKEFLKAGYIENYHLFPTEKGTPQGGPISPIIGNMSLNGLENALAMRFYSRSDGTIDKSHQNRRKVNYVRFADDLVVTADSPETALEIIDVIQAFLDPRGLKLSEEKTLVTNISEGFNFLGWNFRKYKGKLLPKPSKDSQKEIIKKIRDVLHKAKAWDQDRLIQTLNPIIRGWAEYHNHAVSSAIFNKLDEIVYNMLISWAKRRHSNKGFTWITTKYWHKSGKRKYVFCTELHTLERFSNAKIVRQRLASLNKNPFIDKEYFEQWKFMEYHRKKRITNPNSVLN
ncbi:group II intron reverse transcriptase/maturase [Methanosarcina mazei]|uniref:DNA polymerase n=1 Tax=Methanosarcina mazei TaxID=2209 RepID=A0A0F8EXD6_METMZ|nr:group II intron reverse transcriptase/maturase [Methanosarcina mazei]KKG34764.1 DNA polymerase [Methanosarcina mazei]